MDEPLRPVEPIDPVEDAAASELLKRLCADQKSIADRLGLPPKIVAFGNPNYGSSWMARLFKRK